LCFSIVSIILGSSAFTVVTEPGWEVLGPIIGWEVLASVPLETRDSVPSDVFPYKWGRVPEVSFSGGTPS
jgi:hypothetical protein